MSIPGSVTIVSTRDHVDEAVLRHRFRKMKRGEVCYLFPEPPKPGPETTWHGYVQKVAGGTTRKREFAIQGHRGASEQRYREVGLEAAVGFAMKIKPRAVIVA